MKNPPIDSYQKELQNIKRDRKKQVVEVAKQLFYQNGMESTTFNDIAAKAGVGVASLYRYFGNKNDLVIAVAELAAKDFVEWEANQFKSMSLDGTGKENLKALFVIFTELYTSKPDYICFIGDFDNYVQKESIPANKLTFYDQTLLKSMECFCDAFDQGFEDGSIDSCIDSELYIKTISLSLITLSQKLLLNGNIVESDKNLRGCEHIQCLIDMCLNSL